MTIAELYSILARHEMLILEQKDSFNIERNDTACAFANAGGDETIMLGI